MEHTTCHNMLHWCHRCDIIIIIIINVMRYKCHQVNGIKWEDLEFTHRVLINVSDNMERDLIEQATQWILLNWILEKSTGGNTMRRAHRSFGKAESCQMPDYRSARDNQWSHVSRDSRIWRMRCIDDSCMWIWILMVRDRNSVRILIGAMINYNHIELRRFLKDAGDVIIERVRDTVERYDSVKVNTTFNDERAINTPIKVSPSKFWTLSNKCVRVLRASSSPSWHHIGRNSRTQQQMGIANSQFGNECK